MIAAALTLALKLFALFVLVPLATAFFIEGCRMARMSKREIQEEFGPSESQIEFQKIFGRGR